MANKEFFSAWYSMRIRCLYLIFVYFLCCALVGHSKNAHADRSKDTGLISLDKFKTCLIDLRYREQDEKLIDRISGKSKFQKSILIKDGYATLLLQSSLHGLRVSQITIPTDSDAWPQYRVRIDSSSSKVRKVLQQAWDVEFESTGVDGMDGATGSSFRIRNWPVKVRIFSASNISPSTYLECNT
jgi:hypothetical protein